MSKTQLWSALVGVIYAMASLAMAAAPRQPLFQTLDIDKGEAREIQLANGKSVKVKLLDIQDQRDSLRQAIRRSTIKIEINGTAATLVSGTYHLPITVGDVQIDCPITKGYYDRHDTFEDSWGLDKDARVRIWPKDSPLMQPGTFAYPAKQRWFASPTQIGNEPSYVDGGDFPSKRTIYYHAGNDIGGCEGMIEVVSACDGLVASAGGKAMPEYSDAPFYKPRGDYDYVYVIDEHGWFYRYAHLQSIDPAIQPGSRVKIGQKIGVLGKEGSSGGWAHLHFDIKARQPSGKWGVQDAYPFLWEAYQRQYKPQIIAVARPHYLAAPGEKITLDGSGSWSAAGKIAAFHWTFGDGSTAEGATAQRTYDKPGSYSEILKVTDAAGNVDYDFAIVQVLDRDEKAKLPPTIHPSYSPTFDIKVGDPVTFKVRTFRADKGDETWNFGDGSEPVKVRSAGSVKEHVPDGYAQTAHRFQKPGNYIVSVEGLGADGSKAVGRLVVRVEEKVAAAPGVEFWVAPSGNDADPGTKEKPFATLTRARDAVREARKSVQARNATTVWLSGGIYELKNSFVLDAQDSGSAEAPVVYRSVPGEQARIVGGKSIPPSAFKPWRHQIVAVDLKDLGITDYGKLTRRGGIERDIQPSALELFFNDRPMTLARWPNQDFAKIAAVPEGPKGERFVYEGDRPRRWSDISDVWVHGYFNRNWCDTYERVASIDLEKRAIATAEPHDYRGYKAGQRIEFINVLEELDEPGEWYLDRSSGVLYFWPPEPLEGAQVMVSLLQSPLVEMRNTQYIALRGLTLECTRGSAVEIPGGHHNLVAGCIIKNIGTVAVAIGGVVPDLERRIYNDTTFKGDAGSDNGVISCDIHDIGECAIILGGGDRKTLERGGNYVVNNEIQRFGRWVRTYRPAVFMYGVGNRVANNVMHDAPHTAVLMWGNDHVLEYNEVYRVCTETGDAGAFYIGRDWSQRGSIVRYNYFHELGATLKGSGSFAAIMGVYLDDQASGVTVSGNIFHRVDLGSLVGGGRDNVLENNIFSSCGRAIALDARGVNGNYSDGETLFDRLKAVNHDQPPYSERYPPLAKILKDEPGQPKGNAVVRNIFVNTPSEIFSLSKSQQFVRELVKVENNLAQGDSGLVAPQQGDFRLRDNSPAARAGFVAVPVKQIGLYPDEYRRLLRN